MVYPDIALGLHRRLGVQGHPGPGQTKHAQIIGAVAHGEDIGWVHPQAGRNVVQGLHLGLAPQNRAADLSGQFSVLDQQAICAVLVKAQLC